MEGLGGVLGASWRVLKASWELLGGSWGRLESLWGGLGGVLGASWRAFWTLLGASWRLLPKSVKNGTIIVKVLFVLESILEPKIVKKSIKNRSCF